MRGILSIVCLLLAVLGMCRADTCVGTPATLPLGASCGGALSCAYGLYCDKSAVCSNKVEAGKTCDVNTRCVDTATCKGPTDSLLCVANANPGEPCSNSMSDSVARCPNACLDSVCTGGMVGDGCLQNSDCYTNLTCTGGFCTALGNGQFCTSSQQCLPGSTCLQSFCTPQILTGDCTQSSSLCGYGSFCVYNPVANTTRCLQMDSLNDGEYCGGYGFLCKNSKRCENSLCAPGRVSQCAGGQCSDDEYCTCGGIQLTSGIGQCNKNPCLDLYGKYTKCLYEKCKDSDFSYTRSCMRYNCAQETLDYSKCSSGSILSVSILLVALFSGFVSRFSF